MTVFMLWIGDYDGLLRGGHDYIGKDVYVEGIITQVIYDTSWASSVTNFFNAGTFCNILLDASYGSNEKRYLGTYMQPKDATRFLEGDTVSLYGEFVGLEQMEMTFGPPVTFPTIDVRYVAFTAG